MAAAKTEAHQSGMIVILDQVKLPLPIPDLQQPATFVLAVLCGRSLIPKYNKCHEVIYNTTVITSIAHGYPI